ncbi:unnamed protein product [Cuscuta campestris]|uniref:Uncharacterized protein n=1 Tax=Cuscuta campestris TaxID=132261 RepID=A0A484MZ46_9ASTE|nr:unnamed protein product [Cuscuta campestris]
MSGSGQGSTLTKIQVKTRFLMPPAPLCLYSRRLRCSIECQGDHFRKLPRYICMFHCFTPSRFLLVFPIASISV